MLFAAAVDTLSEPDMSIVVSSVPSGVKSNVYFLVSNTENDARVSNGQRRAFVDDCGAWSNMRGNNSVVVGNGRKELFEHNSVVCDRKRIDRKDQLVPIDPQPEAASVRKVTRYCYKLKRCPTYTKRITMLSGSAVYLVEYVGAFPMDCSSHGHCKSEGTQYVRTQPEVLQTIQQQCLETKHKPKKIFETMTVNNSDDAQCPRNLKQVQNISVAVTEKLIHTKVRGTNNLADEMQTLCSFVADNEFVRSVTFTSQHAPCAILYTDDQVKDLKRFCGAESPNAVRSVLCVDRTFNVSSLFLTLTVFKNMSVVRRNTNQPPCFYTVMVPL